MDIVDLEGIVANMVVWERLLNCLFKEAGRDQSPKTPGRGQVGYTCLPVLSHPIIWGLEECNSIWPLEACGLEWIRSTVVICS